MDNKLNMVIYRLTLIIVGLWAPFYVAELINFNAKDWYGFPYIVTGLAFFVMCMYLSLLKSKSEKKGKV